MTKLFVSSIISVWTSILIHQTAATFQLLFEPRNSLLFHVNSGDQTKINNLVTYVDDFLKSYEISKQSENLVGCENSTVTKPPKGKVCEFPVTYEALGKCSKYNDFSYGYKRYAPCAFLKFKTNANWSPDYHDCDSAIAANIPHNIGDKICNDKLKEKKRKIWVSCVGTESIDVELAGPIALLPQEGFDDKYILNHDIEGWVSPLVAIHFQRPFVGILVKVECKAWAKNINHKNGEGIVVIEMMIE